MDEPQDPWNLTDAEWETLGALLDGDGGARRSASRGRPRFDDTRALAEACLFRSFHCLSRGRNHTFNWNALPDSFGASPSTVNRRFREWSDSGAWPRFWTGLLRLRAAETRARPRRPRQATPYPVSDLLGELQRAYHFFNEVLFGGVLPEGLAINILRGMSRGHPLGYFCGRSWRWGTERPVDLIAISGFAIGLGPEAALETLIHEMVHHRNDRFGLVDCTNHGRYHNRFFRDAAVLAGLTCGERDNQHGYGRTALDENARRAIERLRPRKDLFRSAEDAGKATDP